MRCSGCSKELGEQEQAYATVTGSIEKNLLLNNALGFYMDLKPWHSVLCKDCGMAVHDFINSQLQNSQQQLEKHLENRPKPFRRNK